MPSRSNEEQLPDEEIERAKQALIDAGVWSDAS
jgi:hypothetical protein